MALNKMVQIAIKAISTKDINVKKNYKAVRKVINMTHPAYRRPNYHIWDHKVMNQEVEIPVRIFTVDKKIRPVLIFFHGGGWVTGNIDSYNRVCSNLAKLTGHVVVSVDYRLAPEYKFPAAPEDCYYVAREIIQNSKEFFGVEPDEVTLIGDSAGANLAAVVSLMARDRKEFKVSKQILVYPAVNNDFTEQSVYPSIRENGTDYFLTSKRLCDYMDLYQSSPKDRENPYFAPILANDLSNQPKSLVITAEFDPLRDEGEAYAKKLASFGNDVELHRIPDVLHGFFTLSLKLPAVMGCYKLISRFLNEFDVGGNIQDAVQEVEKK